MNKLDKIETEAAECADDVDSTNWMKDHAGLLIRAIRQLASAADISDLFWAVAAGKIDADVMEFIEEVLEEAHD